LSWVPFLLLRRLASPSYLGGHSIRKVLPARLHLLAGTELESGSPI